MLNLSRWRSSLMFEATFRFRICWIEVLTWHTHMVYVENHDGEHPRQNQLGFPNATSIGKHTIGLIKSCRRLIISVYVSTSPDVLSECGVITRINKQQLNQLILLFVLSWVDLCFLCLFEGVTAFFPSFHIHYLKYVSCKLNSWSTGHKAWQPPW